MTRRQWAAIITFLLLAAFINIRNVNIFLDQRAAYLQGFAGVGQMLEGMTLSSGKAPFRLPVREEFKSDSLQIVLVLSPSCRFCLDNLRPWRRVVSLAQANSLRIVAISTRDDPRLQEFTEHLGEPILVASSRDQLAENRFVVTPQTLLLTRDGRVEPDRRSLA